jgi:hypothetical protein
LRVIQKTGIAEVLLPDNTTATGSYVVVFEPSATRAKGVLRLDDSQAAAHTAIAPRVVTVRFDGKTELRVNVHLFVPAAGFMVFTCLEAQELVRH